ncbi:hypothetical protein FOC1_g10008428 [Fusarium oxysporum f. sp. cubense race 1]|uniref:Uncharacterized protein n=1 Tax=Fusarium oxysporum f. sp. cubense (strain race 1) TaxID=1229664 RepID=N4UQJ1_FUSC1|nr:hypothetical protein FOC1_g10008428 [Fusarium oxysporum f. sp. cubense race 1]
MFFQPVSKPLLHLLEHLGSANHGFVGPVWRVKYPSRFGRDALCCDVSVRSSPINETCQLRLINVHLDSLPVQPLKHPEQLRSFLDFCKKLDVARMGELCLGMPSVLPR